MARDHSPTADLVCQQCKMFGCDCPQVCSACHRRIVDGICLCRSRVRHKPAPVDKYGELIAAFETPKDRVDAAEKELLHYWYDTRDPAAAVRLVRELATLAYRTVRQPAEA